MLYRVAWKREPMGGTLPPDSKLHLTTVPRDGYPTLCGVIIPQDWDCREIELETSIPTDIDSPKTTRFMPYVPCKKCFTIRASKLDK